MPEETPAEKSGATGQSVPAEQAFGAMQDTAGVVAPSGKRQAFRDIRRQLTDDDLRSLGVQKLILEELERAEAQCELLQSYVERFHDADKKVGILEVKLKTNTTIEIMFSVGIGLGGAIIGLVPFFWAPGKPHGIIALIVGIALIGGAVVARIRS
jgi:hypothetical protein